MAPNKMTHHSHNRGISTPAPCIPEPFVIYVQESLSHLPYVHPLADWVFAEWVSSTWDEIGLRVFRETNTCEKLKSSHLGLIRETLGPERNPHPWIPSNAIDLKCLSWERFCCPHYFFSGWLWELTALVANFLSALPLPPALLGFST